jgi:hypothetical protein
LGTADQFVATLGAIADFRIKIYPNVHFVVIINPNSGPNGRPILPDEQYQRAVPLLRGYPNVTLVGYIKTSYGKRDIKESLADIDTYWRWHQERPDTKTGFGPMGLDGILVDEVAWQVEKFGYFEELSRHIKGKQWKSGKPGTLHSWIY